MSQLVLLASVITGTLAQGPAPAEEVVTRAMLRFEAVEVRRGGDADVALYRLAVQLPEGWWTGPTYALAAQDGHTCHSDQSKVKSVRLHNLALPSKRRAAVAQIDVDWTMYRSCPPDEPAAAGKPWKPVPVERWTERTFLVCAANAAGDQIECAPPIVTRTRDRCTKKATLTADTLDVPCEASWLDTHHAAHHIERGKSTLDF